MLAGVADLARAERAALVCHPLVYRTFRSLALARLCFGEAMPGVDTEALRAGLRVRRARDVAAVRRRLVSHVWRRPELPLERMPDRVSEGIRDSLLDGLPNLLRIDLLETRLPFGFVARTYHLLPRRRNGRLAIYHEGHDGSFRRLARGTIGSLLARGFDVLAFDLPMRGVNGWPERVDVPGLGPVSFTSASHWSLALLDTDDFSALRLFLDPLVRGVNHAVRAHAFERIVMVGISAGGWAATVYPALDPRIARSYPVAGSLPFALRRRHPVTGRHASDGDYEQRVAAFYRIAGYLDLYVLGAAGAGRRQLQIVNRYDPCCFFGSDAKLLEPVVADALAGIGMGGSFAVLVDDTHARHAISPAALARIIEDAMEPGEELYAQSLRR